MAEDAASDPQLPQLPLLDASRASVDEQKPTWRGWLHAVTFPITVAGGIILISVAHGTTAKWAAAVFMVSSMLLFGNSALYHRFNWSPKVKMSLKRIDHANIFLLIAGTYTPLALLALPPAQSDILLIVVWSGAVLGIGFRVFWIGAPRWLYVALYLALGWAAVAYMVPLFQANAAMMVLVLLGGLLYTIGALAYALKRPNPWPGRFGFHEIFHACTVLAYICHWSATLLIVLEPVYRR